MPIPKDPPGKIPVNSGIPPDANCLDDDPSIKVLFDDRPAEPPSQPNILVRAIANMARVVEDAAKACQEAIAWVGEKLRLVRADPVVTAPFDVKKESLPQDLQAQIEAHRRGQAAKEAAQNFTNSVNVPPNADSSVPPEEGEEAFNAYLKLRKKSSEPQAIACPQNFRDGAVKYAQGFVQRVADRKATADQAEKEFWLSPDDQARYAAAMELLEMEVQHKRPDEVKKIGPIATHSADQYTSFHAWLAWRKDPNQLPKDEGFSSAAALAYANTLIQTHVGKPEAQQEPLKTWLQSAHELVADPRSGEEMETKIFEASTLSLLSDLRTPIPEAEEAHGEQGGAEGEDLPLGPPPPPPPPRIPGGTNQTPQSTPLTNQPLAPPPPPPPRVPATATGKEVSVQTGRTPPSPPLPRVTANPSSLPPEWRTIPDFGTLDDDLKVQSTVLLNRFFKEFSDQIRLGAPDFGKHPNQSLALGASAAVDFLKRALASNEGAATTEPDAIAAASYIINEHLRRENSRRNPGA